MKPNELKKLRKEMDARQKRLGCGLGHFNLSLSELGIGRRKKGIPKNSVCYR